MWDLLKVVIKEEMRRLWRRMLKKPEPPNPYTQFRLQREASLGPHESGPGSGQE